MSCYTMLYHIISNYMLQYRGRRHAVLGEMLRGVLRLAHDAFQQQLPLGLRLGLGRILEIMIIVNKANNSN